MRNLCEEEVAFMEVRRYITIVEEILEEIYRSEQR